MAADPHVRAAARLSREFPRLHRNWYGSWAGELESRLERAVADRSISSPEDEALLRAVASFVVVGAEACLSGTTAALGGPLAGVAPPRLDRIWGLILPRLAEG
jgi:hypothetical protein